MVLTFHGRLPGVVCEATPLAPQENPLRLDVAAFVGFAERGPLDQPIAVEDMSQYHAVFGGDLLLARERQYNQPVYANLPAAVQAFFDNGGQRCYVVRVAGEEARPNRFRLPGLLAWDQETLKTVLAPAAWVGRWSNAMGVGTRLHATPLTIVSLVEMPDWESEAELQIIVPAQTAVHMGDVLRLRFGGPDELVVFSTVDALTSLRDTQAQGLSVAIQTSTQLAFTRNCSSLSAAPQKVGLPKQTETLAFSSISLDPLLEGGHRLQIELPVDAATISSSDVLIINDHLQFPVEAVVEESSDASRKTLRLISQSPYWQLVPDSVERLTETGWQPLPLPVYHLLIPLASDSEYILHVSASEALEIGDVLRMTWGDEKLLFPICDVDHTQDRDDASLPGSTVLQAISRTALWEMQKPVASARKLLRAEVLNFDLVIREGLATEETWYAQRFGPGTNYWIDTCVPQTLSDVLQPGDSSQRIPGLDAARSSRLGVPFINGNSVPVYLPLSMDETLNLQEFASPLPEQSDDAAFSFFASKDGLEQFVPVELFLDPRLVEVGTRDLLNTANQILYLNSDPASQPLRKLHSLLLIDEISLIALPDLVHRRWDYPASEIQPPRAQIDWSRFQRCCAPDPGAPDLLQMLLPLEARLPEPRQQLNDLPVLQMPDQYDSQQMLQVQHALINVCAARADMLAVLSLPQHFKREVLEWQQKFISEQTDPLDGSVLSYATVYHPWLQTREVATPELASLRASPPDGAICGMIASRGLQRGPWIAPANVPLSGVVGLTPELNAASWSDLFNAQINIVRQQLGQFTPLSAHTLSADSQFLQISVRRLLIFLRKLALQRGMQYVFETNSERFRQRVQSSFERLLTLLMEQGALNAFEVVAGGEVNTAQDVDLGRFLIALKVTPTQPVEFITIVLLRAGEGLLQAIER